MVVLEAVTTIAKTNGPKKSCYEKRVGGAVYIVLFSSIPMLDLVFSTIFQRDIRETSPCSHAISSDCLNKLGMLHKELTPW